MRRSRRQGPRASAGAREGEDHISVLPTLVPRSLRFSLEATGE